MLHVERVSSGWTLRARSPSPVESALQRPPIAVPYPASARPLPVSQPSPHPKTLLERAVVGDEPVDHQTSLELLRRAQLGERAALESLIARCQERLRRIVRIQLGGSILRQHYDSMDIVQGTFEAALPTIAELKVQSAGALLQWLSVVATNVVFT